MMNKKPKVFILDDEPLFLEQIQIALNPWARVEVFDELKKFYQAIDQTDDITAILLDYTLTEAMPGYKVLERLRREYKHIPVIMCTGKDRQGAALSYGKGAYAVLMKPLDHNELQIIVHELQSRHELFQQMADDTLDLAQIFDCSIVWQLDKKTYAYKVVAWKGDLDRDYHLNTILQHGEVPWIHQHPQRNPFYRSDVLDQDVVPAYIGTEAAKKRNWHSLITIPLVKRSRVLGWIDCYSHKVDAISDVESRKSILKIFEKYAHQASAALHAEALTRQLRIVQEITQRLSWASTEMELFNTLLGKAQEYLGYSCAWIHKYNFLVENITLNAHSIQEPLAIDSGILSNILDDETLKKIAHEGQTERIRSRAITALELDRTACIRSLVYVPIKRAENQILGVLTVASVQNDFFSLDDVQFLHSLAAAAAVVIDQVKSTRHLQEISNLAQSGASDQKFTQYIVDAARDLTHADVLFWKLSDRENEGDQWMRIAAHSGKFHPDFISKSKVPNDPNVSSNALALASGKTVIIENVTALKEGERFYQKHAPNIYEWKSFMAIPLLSKTQNHMGVLSLYSHDLKYFSQEGSHLIQHFASQTALALQEQRHIVSLHTLSQIGQDLTIGLPGRKELIQKVVNLGLNVSNADTTVLYPFDIHYPDIFDIHAVAFSDSLRPESKKLTEKPKTDGVAAMTRKYGMLVIEDLKSLKGNIRAGYGPNLEQSLTIEEFETLYNTIRNSRFIKNENIGSFIAVTLRAVQVEKVRTSTDVGIMYFNYRSPRKFDSELIRVVDIFARQTANIIYRNRLIEDIQQKRDLLDSVNRATLKILEQSKPQKQLNEIILAGMELLKASGGAIFKVIHSNSKDAELSAGINLPKGIKRGYVLNYNRGLAGEVIHTKTAVVVNDYANYENHHPPFKNHFSALVGAPLMRQDEVIGVLIIFADREKRQFSQEDAVALDILTSQASAAMYGTDLFQELDVFYTTGLRLSATESLKPAAFAVLGELKHIIDYDKATIQIIPHPNKARQVLARRGYTQGQSNRTLLGPIEQDPLISEIVKAKTPIVIPQTHEDSRWDKNIPETQDVRSWACIPLIHEEEVFGLITIDHHIPDYYRLRDTERLKRFSPQASTALQKATLFEQTLKQKKKFEAVIAQITNGITGSAHMEQLHRSLTNSTLRIFSGAHLVEIYILIENGTKLMRLVSQGTAKINNKGILNIDVNKGLVAEVLRSGEAKLLTDTKKYPDYQEIIGITYSEILAPIKQNNTIIGLLNIEHPEKNGLEGDDLRIAEALCNLVAIIKEKGDLLRQLSLLESFLRAVKEVDALAAEDGIDAVFAILAKNILKINPENTIGCRFYLEDKNFFNLEAVRNKAKEKTKLLNVNKLKLGVGFIGQVYQSGVATLIEDADNGSQKLRGRSKKSLALTPIWNGGKTIGLVSLEGNKPHAFNEQELSVLKALSLLSENKIYQLDQYRRQKEAFRRKFNPYIVGGAIEDPKLFFGREKLAQDILNGIHLNHYFIKGVRRIGKSSLIRHLIHRLRFQDDKNYVFFPILYDLQAVNPGGFFVQFARRIIQNLDLIDQIPLPDPATTFEYEDFQKCLTLALEALVPRANGREIRLIAFIDEIQKIDRLGAHISEQLRAILIEEDALKLVMTGFAFFKQRPSETSPFNIHQEKELSILDEDEAIALIIEPVRTKYTFDQDAIDLILSASQLEPMRVQLLCYEAVNNMYATDFDEHNPRITRYHVELSLDKLNTASSIIK